MMQKLKDAIVSLVLDLADARRAIADRDANIKELQKAADEAKDAKPKLAPNGHSPNPYAGEHNVNPGYHQ